MSHTHREREREHVCFTIQYAASNSDAHAIDFIFPFSILDQYTGHISKVSINMYFTKCPCV